MKQKNSPSEPTVEPIGAKPGIQVRPELWHPVTDYTPGGHKTRKIGSDMLLANMAVVNKRHAKIVYIWTQNVFVVLLEYDGRVLLQTRILGA